MYYSTRVLLKLFSIIVATTTYFKEASQTQSGRPWDTKANDHSRAKIEHAILCMFKFDRSHIIVYNTMHFFTLLPYLSQKTTLAVSCTFTILCSSSFEKGIKRFM